MTKEELIATLERAEGPDWELDGHIADVLGLHMPDDATVRPWDWPLKFTSSLDAALTLVPDHDSPDLPGKWRWSVGWPAYDNGVWLPGKHSARIHHPLSSGGGPRWDGFGPTPTIALCIAALKARTA